MRRHGAPVAYRLLLLIVAHALAQQIELYFGAGSFWDVQHAFVQFERRVLSLSDAQLTATAGYAGGAPDPAAAGDDARRCAAAPVRFDDHARRGHAQVVAVRAAGAAHARALLRAYFELFRDFEGRSFGGVWLGWERDDAVRARDARGARRARRAPRRAWLAR